jgi:hypothetical protein
MEFFLMRHLQGKILFLALILATLLLTTFSQNVYAYTQSLQCGNYSSIVGQSGTVMLSTISSCDDCTELVALPFTFNWYGDTSITQVRVSSNGQININSADTSSNCCSADSVVVGGSYTQPRIAVAQEDLNPGASLGAVYALDTGSSYIIDYSDIAFFGFPGNVQAQVELFPDGRVEIRWGQLVSDNDSIAVGVEDDTRIPPAATPAAGAPFNSTGIAPFTNLPQNQCRLFTPPQLIPTMTEWGMIIFTVFAGLGAIYYLRKQSRAKS